MPTEYVDSDGRVPRGATDIDYTNLFRQALLIALCLREGGSLEVGGFATPEAVNRLLYDYELKISGAGLGTFRLEAVPKP